MTPKPRSQIPKRPTPIHTQRHGSQGNGLQKWLILATFVLAVATLLTAGITAWMAHTTQQAFESNLLDTRLRYFKDELDQRQGTYLAFLTKLASNLLGCPPPPTPRDNFCDQAMPEKKEFCRQYFEYVKTWSDAEALYKCSLDYLDRKEFNCVRTNLSRLEQQLIRLDELYENARAAYFETAPPESTQTSPPSVQRTP